MKDYWHLLLCFIVFYCFIDDEREVQIAIDCFITAWYKVLGALTGAVFLQPEFHFDLILFKEHEE